MQTTIIEPDKCVRAVAKVFGISRDKLTGGVRANHNARTPVMLLALMLREHTVLSLNEIAQAMGRRSHAGVIYLCGIAGQEVKDDPDTARMYHACVREARA